MLARWLPSQRWFSGRGSQVSALDIIADTTLLDGDPGLRHLIVAVANGAGAQRYQVLVGQRSAVPDTLAGAVIGPLDDRLTAYDATADAELRSVLLGSIAEERKAGPLRFGREPGAPVGRWQRSRVLAGEQSNTSIVFGDAAILKVLRRLYPGANPDLEVTSALSRLGSPRVAAPYGWIETELDGEPVLLAVLSRYLAGAQDGWTLASHSLREGGESFAGEAYLLGRSTAALHADLAVAFGTSEFGPGELTGLAGRMTTELEQATAEVPRLREHAGQLRAAYAALAEIDQPVPVQRIHGDYHLGQVLRTADGWVTLDFEGEPAVPLARRRAPAPALRDVAGMLRSFDYAARHQLIDDPGGERLSGLAEAPVAKAPVAEAPVAEAPVAEAPVAEAWVKRCQDRFCAGYADAAGSPARPGTPEATLLRAMMLEKAVYEVRYEAQYRPAWLAIPLDSIAAVLATSPAGLAKGEAPVGSDHG
jgi:maltokinase